MLTPVFKSAAVGFVTGSTVPLLVTTLYLMPQHQYSEQQELNWLKRIVGVLTWQVKKLEARQLGIDTAKLSEGYRDGLYWAGF
ncbi:unnamed protein product [Cyberlindnera jadinii]|uniref:Uncharacterized protein n=1 Tax=Cyberlindnera jadinii (strain ATCC 18201 / CBS 1600 / BCRC 20928 / JCM 3617 / NBRC 0987 / NRRL Y-1542) TaxID=983966 RepID=A0A0H5C863_CYBJN|nr:hypothetical protein CYBJADRAFT_169670 [Cyberlindnera jadinii NRRL Y-1542]ODV71128.1 hypothetical protein CYBJADRAFT_169670 [Cyberlindnera jadinii NRRL Y-1542]CEP24177.1 unnamed protein product [Cyberlindnera jadinii]